MSFFQSPPRPASTSNLQDMLSNPILSPAPPVSGKSRRRSDNYFHSGEDKASRGRSKSNSKLEISTPRRARSSSKLEILPRRSRSSSQLEVSSPRRSRSSSKLEVSPPRRSNSSSKLEISSRRRSRSSSKLKVSLPRRSRSSSKLEVSSPRSPSSSSELEISSRKRTRSSSRLEISRSYSSNRIASNSSSKKPSRLRLQSGSIRRINSAGEIETTNVNDDYQTTKSSSSSTASTSTRSIRRASSASSAFKMNALEMSQSNMMSVGSRTSNSPRISSSKRLSKSTLLSLRGDLSSSSEKMSSSDSKQHPKKQLSKARLCNDMLKSESAHDTNSKSWLRSRKSSSNSESDPLFSQSWHGISHTPKPPPSPRSLYMTRASTRNSMIAELQKEYQELPSSPAAITQSSSLPDLLSPTKSRLVSPGMRSKSPISFHMNRASSRNSLIAELQKEYQKLSSSSASIIKASSSPELLSSTTFLKPPLSPDRHLPPKSPRSFHSESSTITKVCSSSPEILNITKPPISKSILSDDIDPLPIKASLILQFARSRNGVVTEVEKEYKRKSKAARAEKMETSLEVEREEKSLSLKTEEKERKKKLEQLRRQQEESIRKKAELANLQKLKLEPPKIKEWYRFQQAQEESEEEQEVMTRLTKVRDKAEIQRQLQLQIQQAEEEVKHMRRIRVTKEKLLKMEQQLLRIEQETDIEKERMRNEFEKTKEHARKDIVLRLDAMRAVQERKRVLEDLRIQVELENEQKNLKAIIKEIEPMISELKKQNVRRSGENMEISVMFEGLNEHAKLKTREKKALLDEQKQLVKMCDEAISLSAEPKLKQIFRKGVYKCAQGAIESDLYDHCLCEKIKKVIRDTESKLGCEALILDRPSTFTRQFHNSFNGLHPIVEDDESSGSGEVDNYLEFDIREFATEVDKQLAGLNRLSTVVDTKQLSTLYENKDLLKAIFQFMDKEANGTVDLEEFQVGIDLLNRRLPDDTQFEDPVGLFKALDLDGNGKLDIDDEFNFVFMQNAETSEYCWGESTSSLQHPFY